MKSMLITSHFHSRMGSGFCNLVGCLYSTFTCWHSMQCAKYSATYFFILGQNKSFLIIVIIFYYPWCPEFGRLCNSSITVSLMSIEFGIYNLSLCSNNPLPSRLRSVFIWFLSFSAVFSFRV